MDFIPNFNKIFLLIILFKFNQVLQDKSRIEVRLELLGGILFLIISNKIFLRIARLKERGLLGKLSQVLKLLA
jgi:hypothetical protein